MGGGRGAKASGGSAFEMGMAVAVAVAVVVVGEEKEGSCSCGSEWEKRRKRRRERERKERVMILRKVEDVMWWWWWSGDWKVLAAFMVVFCFVHSSSVFNLLPVPYIYRWEIDIERERYICRETEREREDGEVNGGAG